MSSSGQESGELASEDESVELEFIPLAKKRKGTCVWFCWHVRVNPIVLHAMARLKVRVGACQDHGHVSSRTSESPIH